MNEDRGRSERDSSTTPHGQTDGHTMTQRTVEATSKSAAH